MRGELGGGRGVREVFSDAVVGVVGFPWVDASTGTEGCSRVWW